MMFNLIRSICYRIEPFQGSVLRLNRPALHARSIDIQSFQDCQFPNDEQGSNIQNLILKSLNPEGIKN